MTGSLAGQVAIVTGGSGGIGSEAAVRLAEAGASVAVHYHSQSGAAQAVADRICAAGGAAFACTGDIADPDGAASLTRAVVERFGRLDILINNAGISSSLAFGEVTPAAFDREFHANLLTAVMMTQAAVPLMGESGGRIVNVGTNLVRTPLAGLSLYTATKAALQSLTLGWSKELASRSIAVNAVAPGATRTGQTAWITDDVWSQISAATPLGRVADPADIADVIVFLASPAARWITGRTIIVDGGIA